MLLKRLYATTLLLTSLTIPTLSANNIELPAFGDTTSGIISQQQEYELGREWLRAYRSRIPQLNDPTIQFYLEQFIFKLAEKSELQDHRIELILVNNPNMNAFAVPGGVIGVHTGLFRYADNEHQMGSVLSHEIAHLSQRHFARRLEKQRANQYLSMAGILASLVLIATTGGDAGMAGLMATQAAALESRLKYSRQNEQEADRLGIETLHEAGLDPKGVPAMFEGMLRATRYVGSRPPEFLLTHPLTESRIADAHSRARTYPEKQYINQLDYQLIKIRALVSTEKNPALSIKRFKSEINGDSYSKQASQYGLSLSYLTNNNQPMALKTLEPLLADDPNNIYFISLKAAILRSSQQLDKALALLTGLIASNPNYYPARIELAKTYMANNDFHQAEIIFEKLSRKRPTDPFIWYELAETRGLAGNISGVHKARAEYFILTGAFDLAREQLGFAKKLVASDYRQSAIITQRIVDLKTMEKGRKL